MNKSTIFVGIDVSKDTFDVFDPVAGHQKYRNNKVGYSIFMKSLTKGHWCVMESTGSYHQQLAQSLYDSGFNVSVINPVIIKRFIQMKLKRIKTDKSDARLIAQYAREQSVEPWKPSPEYIEECKMLNTVLELYFKQSTSLKNKLHSLKSKGKEKGALVRSLKRQLKQTQLEIKKMEEELEALIKTHNQELFSHITSIPGIGKKTAILLIVCTDGFDKFVDHRQLVSFLGLAPCERSSGSSVRGISRINKKGQSLTRNHLFLCSFTACMHNPACKALYTRLIGKVKSKKLALIAVCNKLVKQAFGIARSGMPFDKNYRSHLAIKN